MTSNSIDSSNFLTLNNRLLPLLSLSSKAFFFQNSTFDTSYMCLIPLLAALQYSFSANTISVSEKFIITSISEDLIIKV